ncbi:MAG TPA: hypothetical protein VF576_08815, partial [Rubricoccaceae bacterium]
AGLRGVEGAPTLGLLAVPVVALGLPLLDTGTTMVRRVVHGHSPFLPDADHIHHRVLARSRSVPRAVVAMWGAGAVFGALAVVLRHANGSDAVQALCGLAVVAFAYLVVRRLRYVRVRVLWRNAQRRRIHRRRAGVALATAAAVASPAIAPPADAPSAAQPAPAPPAAAGRAVTPRAPGGDGFARAAESPPVAGDPAVRAPAGGDDGAVAV